MAQATIIESKLRVSFDNGMNEKGEQIVKTKTYSNVRSEATADQLLQAGRALAGLCSQTLMTIERSDVAELIN